MDLPPLLCLITSTGPLRSNSNIPSKYSLNFNGSLQLPSLCFQIPSHKQLLSSNRINLSSLEEITSDSKRILENGADQFTLRILDWLHVSLTFVESKEANPINFIISISSSVLPSKSSSTKISDTF